MSRGFSASSWLDKPVSPHASNNLNLNLMWNFLESEVRVPKLQIRLIIVENYRNFFHRISRLFQVVWPICRALSIRKNVNKKHILPIINQISLIRTAIYVIHQDRLTGNPRDHPKNTVVMNLRNELKEYAKTYQEHKAILTY